VELAGVKDIDQAKEMIKATPFLEFKEEGPNEEIPKDVLDKFNTEAKKKAEGVLKKALAPEGDFSSLAKENSEDFGSKEKSGDLDFVKKRNPEDSNSQGFVPEFEKVVFDPSFKDNTVWPQLVETQFGWHIIKKIEQRGEGDNLEIHSAHILISKKTNPTIVQKKYVSTGLTGKNLKNAVVDFQNQGLAEPQVALQFDTEGTRLFADLTKKNLNKTIAIYLDGEIVSAPRVQAEITNGQAVIMGKFSIEEANKLVRNLNEGALPVPINLISQQSVEASLGQISLAKSLKAGIIGLLAVVIFMIVYYRFLGVIASVVLLIYAALMIAIFKFSAFSNWQITLTLPGIAGFILSVGMAVDANILIFERIKEEARKGRNILGAVEDGFKRAWTSIRDGNVSSIITSLILIGMGTGFVKGFAVTLVVGVLVSMFTAVVITRTILRFVMGEWIEDKLYLIGIKKKNV
jgi:protein-export membrane protein SecD